MKFLKKIKCELIGNARSANKLYRKLLGRFSLPDFLIIGAQKCGTTAFYSYLVQHPGVVKAEVKEINYFGNPNNYVKGKRWYASHFCTVSYKKRLEKKLGYMPMSGEASPNMHMPFYPKAVHELLPSVKLIALFRDPADRAFSQYHHNRRKGFETLSFEEAIELSPLRLPPEVGNDIWKYHRSTYRSYITRGLYAEQLERWYKYYDKNDIHIINSNDFFENPAAELQKILRFLCLPKYHFDNLRVFMHKGDYEEKMRYETREHLNSLFRAHNKRLFEILERDFGWPS